MTANDDKRTASAKPSWRDVVWRQPDGEPVACDEKLEVLVENLDEIRQACQDALEDAVLMGCDDAQFRSVLKSLIRSIENPYAKGSAMDGEGA
jgi:hypothetical protein